MLVAAAVLVLAVASGGVLLARHQDDRGRLAVGASRQGDYSMGGGYFSGSYRFAVPGANVMVNLEVGRRGSRLNDETSESTKIKAPRHGLLVHLDWSSTVSGGAETKYVGAHRIDSGSTVPAYAGGHPTSLSVRSKGASVVADRTVVPTTGIASSIDDEDQMVVAVPGDLSDIELVATFRGRSQSVSLLSGRRVMGDFAGLYVAGSVQSQGISARPSEPSRGLRSFCTALSGRMVRTPYLDRLGWATPGHEWVLVDGAGVRLADDAARWSDGDHLAHYTRVGTPRVTVTANGRAPVKVLDSAVAGTSYRRTSTTRDYVFSAETGVAVTVDVKAPLTVKRKADGDKQAPARKTLQLHASTTYPAVIDPSVKERR